MQDSLKSFSPYLPWLGLMLILAGAVYALITREFELVTNALLGGGAFLLLLYAILEPDRVRQQVDSRGVRYGLSSFVAVVLFTAIVVLIYYVAFQNSDWRYDVTSDDAFTPLPETEALLENLDEPIEVIGFFSLSQFGPREQAEQILENLESITDNISWRFIDPEVEVFEAERYEVSQSGVLVFIRGEGENETTSRMTFRGSLNAEGDVHNALIRVLNAVEKKIYYLEGHGEHSIDPQAEISISILDSFLSDSGFETETVNLSIAGSVPDDASVIVIIDQFAPLQDIEMNAIADYLAAGGSLLIARDWSFIDQGRQFAEEDGMRAYLTDEWGIRLRPDAVMDPTNQLAELGGPFAFAIYDFGTSPIVNDAVSDTGMVVVTARSIGTQPVEGVIQTPIIQTSADSWGEANTGALLEQGILNYDPELDAGGPNAIVVSAENSLTGGKVVAFGDTDLFTDQGIQFGANYLLISNAFNWMSDDEVSIAVTPRDATQRQVVVPQTQMTALWLISLCLPALIALVIGAVVFSSRRGRR